MRILFYLPVVTPWWFDNIVLPLIRESAKEAEVHVLVAPVWKNTGITADQLRASRDVDNVRWHIVDDPNHSTLRTRPSDPQGLIDFVRGIEPDYTFCRSADAETPSAFPGEVRFLMESGAPPFPGLDRTFVFQTELLEHGEMLALTRSDREMIDAGFADVWKRFSHRFTNKQPFKMTRENALTRMGIDPDRKVIALALEYAHKENFFKIHEKPATALKLLDDLAPRLDDSTVLAVTDHPLNYLYCDNSAVYQALEALGSRALLVPNEEGTPRVTNLLFKHCDGAIVQNSKSIYSAAYFGKPILRLADRPTAPWLNASEELDGYFDQLQGGTARAPEAADVRTWFGLRLTHDIIDPAEISLHEMIDRVERPFDPARMARGLERYERLERAYLKHQ